MLQRSYIFVGSFYLTLISPQTLTKIGKHMYVCGGTSGYTYDLHIHRLDLQTLTWEELPAQSNFVPESRYTVYCFLSYIGIIQSVKLQKL